LIIDASVALAWVLEDETTDYADRILDRVKVTTPVAPAHWPLEVANGLLYAKRRGRIDDEGIAAAGRLLERLPIELVPIELADATRSILETAFGRDLSAYDAAYLDLARFRRAPLATLDDRLRQACVASGVDLA
jgi:predicted nucleic acid-binding protein